MKKFIIAFFASVITCFTANSQESDLVMPYKNYEESKTLESLQVGSNLLEILDFQASNNVDHKYLSYNIFVNLFYESVDPLNQTVSAISSTVVSDVSLNYTLTIEGYKGGTPSPLETVQKTGVLKVSGMTNLSTQVFHINSNELDQLNFTKINKISLSASSVDLAAIDVSTRNQVTLQVVAEYSLYNTAQTVLSTKFEDWHTNHNLKENEVAITWVDVLDGSGGKYELEWVYMPVNWSAGEQAMAFNGALWYPIDWKNAVRIQTKKNHYLLNLIYDEGYLVSRVRTVKNQLNSNQEELIDKLVYGDWSLLETQTPIAKSSLDAQSVIEIHHTTGNTNALDRMNWQYNAVFANDGLKQENVQFFDGSSNLKQSISISQTDEERDLTSNTTVKVNGIKMVAQESYTDNSGQTIIQVMPSPLIGFNSVDYQLAVNTVNDVKILPVNLEDESNPLYFPQPLDNNSYNPGAAQYYSPQNKNKGVNQDENWFIPDAKGYPYIRNEYLKDGSGRLQASYAPGNVLKDDKDKNTQYFYGKPTQSELDILFGTNVGLTKYYKKNATVDGNGVTSLAYIDQKERTIATSMVGEANLISNMVKANQTARRFEDELLEEENVEYNPDDLSFKLTYPIYVPENGDYLFNYELLKNNFFSCGSVFNSASLCHTCNYEFVFQIVNHENKLVFSANSTIDDLNLMDCLPDIETFKNDMYADSNHPLNEQFNTSTKDITVSLRARNSYTIIQELKLKTELIDGYIETNLNDPNCPQKTLEDFVKIELNESKFEDCRVDFISPCSFVRDSLLKDFRYPGGEFVKGAALDDDVVDVIIMRTRRLVNCDGTTPVVNPSVIPDQNQLDAEKTLREGIKTLLRNEFGYNENLTFRHFTEKHFDFFLEYHPSKCKVKACEALNNEESIVFDKLLAESTSAEDFETLLKNSNLNYNSDLDLEYSTNGEIYNHGVDGRMNSTVASTFDFYGSHFTLLNPSGNGNFQTMDLKNDLALFSLDKGIRSFLQYQNNKYGVLEIQQFPASRQCYFIDRSSNSDWGGSSTTWGNGNVEGTSDFMHFMFGYFANFNGCLDGNNYVGITEMSNLAYDKFGQTTAQKTALLTDKWAFYKALYAGAKRELGRDLINYSSCPPLVGSGEQRFAVTNPDIGSNYTHGASSHWAWDKKYDWGDWWANASTCNIYLGEDPLLDKGFDAPLLPDPQTYADNRSSPAAVSEMIKKDIRDLIKATLSSACYTKFITSTIGWGATDLNYISLLNSSNPFDILQTKLGSSCNAYDLNLSSIFAPYYSDKFVNNQGTLDPSDDIPYFSRNYPLKVNCKSFEDAYLSFPANLGTPTLTGEVDIDINHLDQKRFKNWMNFDLGLNLSFEDYYLFHRGCLNDGDNDIFNATISWTGYPDERKHLRRALNDLNNQTNFFWKNLSTDFSHSYFIQFLNTILDQLQLADATVTTNVDPVKDYIDFGSVGYANNHQNLFYLKDGKTKFTPLLTNFNAVFNAIRAELRREEGIPSKKVYPDLQTVSSSNARELENVNGIEFDIEKDAETTRVKIERAIYYSGGTILVRLLDLNNVFFDDYYFYYQIDNKDELGNSYRLSELSDINYTAGFTGIKPIFNDIEVRYVNLETGYGSLIASTSENIATAVDLGKVQLDNNSKGDVFPFELTCEDLKYQDAKINGAINFDEYIKGINETFRNNYIAFCTNNSVTKGFNQSLTMNYPNNERHFTLYYYDQADNLVATVPPGGISPDFEKITATGVKTDLTDYISSKQLVKDYRKKLSNDMIVPKHTLQTTYKYNSDNQIIKQTTPNGGTTLFWYDQQGRLALSQNAEQRNTNKFSYTLYDGQSRIEESGEVFINLNYISPNRANLDDLWRDLDYIYIYGKVNLNQVNNPSYNITSWINTYGQRMDVVKTFYDTDKNFTTPPLGFTQHNLRSRVASQVFYTNLDASSDLTKWQYATHYSYDPVGNVKTVLNDYLQGDRLTDEANRFKRTDYAYDPVSGNVLMVYYQLGKEDAFYHKYKYDAENRIVGVETSRDGVIWDEDATYNYYMHGPLARVEMGDQKVQGIDYAYTLQGWLKAVNSGIDGEDIGGDIVKDNVYGEDAFGFSLQYFNGDYEPIGTNSNFIANHPTPKLAELHNGNIAAKTMHNQENTVGKVYTYDQLNRLKNMEEYNISGLLWNSLKLDGYGSFYAYDPNGNITDLYRFYNTSDYENGVLSQEKLDDMDYTYISGTDKLDHVSDDIETASTIQNFKGQLSGNYEYDAIGNLTKDLKNKIEKIEWYPNGKIKRVIKEDAMASNPDLFFEYDALGNRVKKEVSFVEDGKFFRKSTYYSRDAQGNELATYDEKDDQYMSSQGEEDYYQFSHDFGYYSEKASEILTNGSDDLIDYLNSTSFNRQVELANSAYLNLSSIPNSRALILADLDVSTYLTTYPDATRRIVENNVYSYANELYTGHFNTFLSYINSLNEAWISALRVNNDEVDFYDNFDNLFSGTLSLYEQRSTVNPIFTMNRVVLNEIITSDATLFEQLLKIDNNQYTNILDAYYDQDAGYLRLIDLLGELADKISSQDEDIQDLIREINGILMVININDDDTEKIFDGIDLNEFYDVINWVNDDIKNEFTNMMYHINEFYSWNDVEPAIEVDMLAPYLPMQTLDWSEDNDGLFLEHYLLKNFAHSSLISISELYFTSYSMSNNAIYFDGTTTRPFAANGVINNSMSSVLIKDMAQHVNNLSISKGALYETEDIDHLAYYLKENNPREVLRINYIDDKMLMALNHLNNYKPSEYKADLKLHFNLVSNGFETTTTTAGNNGNLFVESFNIYGSSRLGVMDASLSRKDGENKFSRKLTAKTYELSDHLGNVVATVSDKKLHPQELVTNGNQNVNQTVGFQADVTGRYDRFPFGMEILERSGDIKTLMGVDDSYEIIYDGLLRNNNDYAINSGTSLAVSTAFNVYNQEYATSVVASQIQSASFTLTAKLKVNEVIPNINDNELYKIEILLTGTEERDVTASIGSTIGYVMSPSMGANAPPASLRQAADKKVSFELKGSQINDLETWGKLNILMNVGSAPVGVLHNLTIAIESIVVTQLHKNSSVSLAQRNKAPYKYGFQGQEVDNEWSGVAFGGGEIPLFEDNFNEYEVYHEDYSSASNLSFCSGSLQTLNGESFYEMKPPSHYCGSPSGSFSVEQGEEYVMTVDLEKMVNNGLMVIRWDYFDPANGGSWKLQRFIGINDIGRKTLQFRAVASSNLMRMWIFGSVASPDIPGTTVLGRIYDIKVEQELKDWNVSNRTDGMPTLVNEGGRLKLQNDNNWAGGSVDDIPVTNKGALHKISYEVERTNIPRVGSTVIAYSFILIFERNAGGNWVEIPGSRYSLNDVIAKTNVEREFTPTKDFIKINVMSSGTFAEPMAFYVDNIKITDGTFKEVKGGGTNGRVAFKYRIHDPEIGKFLSRDPLAPDYPWNSPYAFSENRVVDKVELEGLESAEPEVPGADQDPKLKQPKSSTPRLDALNTFLMVLIDGADKLYGLDLLDEGASYEDKIVNVEKGASVMISQAALLTSGFPKIKFNKKTKAEVKTNVQTTQVTPKAARRIVMRQQGIPTSQQPSSQTKDASGRVYNYKVPAEGGGTKQKTVQQQTMDRSHKGSPHYEAGDVKVDPQSGKTRLNQYGRPKIKNQKSKADYTPAPQKKTKHI